MISRDQSPTLAANFWVDLAWLFLALFNALVDLPVFFGGQGVMGVFPTHITSDFFCARF